MSGLTAKSCVPCRGGVPSLTGDEAKRYLGETPNWALDGAASRIERRFAFPDFAGALDFTVKVAEDAEPEEHSSSPVASSCMAWPGSSTSANSPDS